MIIDKKKAIEMLENIYKKLEKGKKLEDIEIKLLVKLIIYTMEDLKK